MRSKPVTQSDGVVARKSSIRKLPNGDGDDDDDCIDDDYSLQGMVLCTAAFRDLHPGLVSMTY